MNNILQQLLSSVELINLFKDQPEYHEKFEELMNIGKEQVMRGSKLIHNVRNLSKIENTEITMEAIEVNNSIKKSIDYLKHSYQTRNFDIQIDSTNNKLHVQANSLLDDVFGNILNNAVQHNNQPIIQIEIKISTDRKNDVKYVKIEFIDNGIGIEDDRKDIIFQRGYMEGRSIRGMGLGLSLVKRIVESYQGHIWVEDNVLGDYSKGSKFILLIPSVEVNVME
jgi:signal transduction histidine kinase